MLYNFFYTTKTTQTSRRHFYNYYHYRFQSFPEKLLNVTNGNIKVHTIWRMQLIGEFYGLRFFDYRDTTNWELYSEKYFQSSDDQEREEIDLNYLEPDSYDEYFYELSQVAAQIGCKTMELKCLAKSLMLKYRRVKHIYELPLKEYHLLCIRLIDEGYLRAARRLEWFHHRECATIWPNTPLFLP